MRSPRAPLLATIVFFVSTIRVASAQEVPDFGLPIAFSVKKMDETVSPRKDFARFAAGTYRDAATIPSDNVRISSMDQMSMRVDSQLRELLEEAARSAATARKGSARQQIGDLYAAGVDEARLTELGVTPIESELELIDHLEDSDGIAVEVARLGLKTNSAVLLGASVIPDIQDRRHYTVLVADGDLGLKNFTDYLSESSAHIRRAYVKYIRDTLVIAGSSTRKANRLAEKILELETRIAKLRQSPVDSADPHKRFIRMSYDELQKLTPTFSWKRYFEAVGVKPPREVLAIEVPSLRERSAIIAELSVAEQREVLKWEYLRRVSQYLSPKLLIPQIELSQAMYGPNLRLPVRSKLIATQLSETISHPLGKLYVERYFSPASRLEAERMISRIRAQFRARLVKNTWLSPATRTLAIQKLDRMKITVGYPDRWIDYSKVDIQPGDYFTSISRVLEFNSRRNFERLGKPVEDDSFNVPRETLPTVINAAYDPTRNAIEIPAAFLQPPLFDPQEDAAVNFCAVGTVIGHELTHGFDSQGRLYDADGNVRNWWTSEDERAFNAQTAKLIRQANQYEVLPGLHTNGELAVGENLADVGGIAFAFGALKHYLKDHPQKRVKIDGYTPEQRCFIAWGQVWADKTSEGFLRMITAIDPHPPGGYRAVAPSQHEPGFYAAFGITESDPMWLPPEDRIRLW